MMDIREFLGCKTLLFVGCTGFLGKVMLEKILRAQPNVEQIYVLVREKDSESAKFRFKNEVLSKELFRTLRAQYGQSYESFIDRKVSPIVGDIAGENLGLPGNTREHLQDKLHIIVNCAANTRFIERYDVAMKVNVGGAKNVVEFGKQCPNLQILLHVSTAYVQDGSKKCLLMERPLSMGETLICDINDRGSLPLLDIDFEGNLIKMALETYKAENLSVQAIANRMKELGLERARKFGWPNTYALTKAMGEMTIGDQRGNLPLVILRPAIIESSLAEPFPGWIEGNRMLDPLMSGHGRGRLTSFIGHPEIAQDVVPVDMVVKAAIAVMARHAREPHLFVYHVASSAVNPLLFETIFDCGYKYFNSHPLKDRCGNEIRVSKFEFLPNMAAFQRHLTLELGKSLQLLAVAGDISSIELFKERYNLLVRDYNSAISLGELYEPYMLFRGRFDISNTERLLNMLSAEDRKDFDFDVRTIDWTDYVLNIHIPGLMNRVFGHMLGSRL